MDNLLFIGILISLAYTEVTGLSPGGIITPAYFALMISDSRKLLVTVVMSFLCLLIVHALSQIMILYGRRRFSMYLLTGILLKLLLNGGFLFSGLSSIGYLIPGLLGKDMEKQGWFSTLLSLGIVTMITLFVHILYREMV